MWFLPGLSGDYMGRVEMARIPLEKRLTSEE